jgi:hypothetical protein
MAWTAIRNGRLLLIGGCAAAAVVAGGALRADLMVSHGFNTVDGKGPTSFTALSRITSRTASPVGDEGYWLTRADVENPIPFAKQLSVGDRITITGQDGRQRVLEVSDLRSLGEPLTNAVTGTHPMRLLLVTCRIIDENNREAGAPIRFIIEGEPTEKPPVQRSASGKAL